MNTVQKMLFPITLIGMLGVVGITRLILMPGVNVQAAAAPEVQPAVVEQSSAEEIKTENCQIAGSYPAEVRNWCDWVMASAQSYGLEANLIAAVMLQESGGNPQAYSQSGAVGLMQVMPRDGIAADFMCVNGPCFSARPCMDELFDPQFNIDYAARMLSGLINQKGNLREALLAYGPMDIGYRYADIVLSIYQNYQ